MKPLRYTGHAKTVVAERDIDQLWVERTVREPDWAAIDPTDPVVRRCYRQVPERGGRILRVAVVETGDEIRILTAFLDRDAVRPQ